MLRKKLYRMRGLADSSGTAQRDVPERIGHDLQLGVACAAQGVAIYDGAHWTIAGDDFENLLVHVLGPSSWKPLRMNRSAGWPLGAFQRREAQNTSKQGQNTLSWPTEGAKEDVWAQNSVERHI